LLYKTLPLRLAFNLECWLGYPLMLLGMYLFLQRLKIDCAAALFGASAFTFGGFNLLHFVHPNAVAVVAHIPWLLLAIDVLDSAQQPLHRRFAFAAIALLTGSQFLLGYPQYVLYSLLIEIGYVFWKSCSGDAKHATGRAISTWLAAVTLGFLVGGVQLLPTLDALQHSVRQSAAADFAGQGSLNPLNLLQLVAPYLFSNRVVGENMHELGLYLGAVPLALAVYWLTRKSCRGFRKLSIAASITAAAALLWAFGTFGPLAWFQANVPLLNKFRFPCRAIVIFQLSAAVLAALGFMLLQRRWTQNSHAELVETNPRFLWVLPIGSALAVVAGLTFWPAYLSSWPLIAAGPVVVTASVWLIQRAALGGRWALPALIVLAAIDLGIYGLSHSLAGQTDSLANFIHATNHSPELPTTRVALDPTNGKESALGQTRIRAGDRILLAGWKRVDGYAGLEPARRLDYCQPAALRVAGAGWISTHAAAPVLDVTTIDSADQRQSRNGWIALPNPQPRAWLVANTVSSVDPAVDISRVPIETTALVDDTLSLPSGTPGTAIVVVDRPGKITAATSSETKQLLVVSESYDRGWQATLDDAEVEILRANGDFLGVVVPPGKHEISLNFAPQSLRWGRLASGFGLGLIVTTLLWPVRAAGRNSKPKP
jgi:membrane protein YdbS with pleckstrin-like domain